VILIALVSANKKKASNLCRQVALICIESRRLRLKPIVEIDPIGPMGCEILHLGAKCESDRSEDGRCGLLDVLAKAEPYLRVRLRISRWVRTANERCWIGDRSRRKSFELLGEGGCLYGCEQLGYVR